MSTIFSARPHYTLRVCHTVASPTSIFPYVDTYVTCDVLCIVSIAGEVERVEVVSFKGKSFDYFNIYMGVHRQHVQNGLRFISDNTHATEEKELIRGTSSERTECLLRVVKNLTIPLVPVMQTILITYVV